MALDQKYVDDLDWALRGYDDAGMSSAGIRNRLYEVGQSFNPHPATKEDINDYIRQKNKERPENKRIALFKL